MINIKILSIAFIIYVYRFSLIENCLFRKNSLNIVEFQPYSLINGLIAPFRLLYLSYTHLNWISLMKTFYYTFITFDNFIFNLVFFKGVTYLFNYFF
uniref:Uncharacterized protein n=1 Tax=Megaviridae environmental sample TaxID=1737588 RepID=A0A5J6VLD9_9VIRU|nr:MAG: hypothetical protein [Megaviridae environmental sample]